MPEIPKNFHSLETDQEFKTCCDCGTELINSAQMYMIQKSFAKNECVMEFALCNNCKEKLDEQISSQSKEAIYDFLFDNSSLLTTTENNTSPSPILQIETCCICAKDRQNCEGYTYSGLFIGTHLIPGPLPMMICDECQGDMHENMSDHTRDVKDKFYKEHFPGPPTEVDLPTTNPITF